MIFQVYLLLIFWTCAYCISPQWNSSPESAIDPTKFEDGTGQIKLAKLYQYVQAVKSIDVEESMESIVELINMLKIIFPIKFASIKQKMYDLYDPVTNRSFGVAFQALTNMIKVKENRDKLQAIFHELTVSEGREEDESGKASETRVHLPLKYKSATKGEHESTGRVAAEEGPAVSAEDTSSGRNDENPSTSATKSAGRRQPTAYGSKGRIPEEGTTMQPARGRARKNDDTEPSEQLQQPAVKRAPYKGPRRKVAESSPSFDQRRKDTVSEEEKAEAAKSRLIRLRKLLDQVKKNNAADPQLQAKAARIAQALAKKRAVSMLS